MIYNTAPTTHRFFPAEWHQQDGILIAWPHKLTDWNYMLAEVTRCYVAMAEAIVPHEQLLIISPEPMSAARLLSHLDQTKIHYFQICTNDTWTRDYGPISVIDNHKPVLLDFCFNAWGMKFASCYDNMASRRLAEQNAFKPILENHLDITLEGGSIESDGNGIVMTTTHCLTAPNRNDALSKQKLEEKLLKSLGCKKMLWLNSGHLMGDDTDGHIDTLARFAPGGVILYNKCYDSGDYHFMPLNRMERELTSFTDLNGNPYRLMPLPLPSPIFDNDGSRLPATYANFLIINNAVLVPTYRQPALDNQALTIIGDAFPHREIIGIDCVPLIQQHGSLHCATMQLIENTLQL